MTTDIKREWLESQLKNAARSISLRIPKGISFEAKEAEKKIFELYEKIEKSEIDHNFDLNLLNIELRKWLMKEKKIPEDLAIEICLPLPELIMDMNLKRLGLNFNQELRQAEGHEGKIIPFPKNKLK